jgi:proline iminopeptidase
MVKAYYHRLIGDDEVARMAAAKAWSIWEGRTATLQPRKSVVDHFSDSFTAFSLARIEAHYFINTAFLQENQILRDADKLKDIPGTIVQGRYDLICPLESAWELHQAWHASDLYIIGDAGHSATEVGIVNALVKATRKMLKRIE